MLGIRCPKCGKMMHSFLEGLLRPTYTNLKCPFCNVRLELVNAGLCHFLSGIIFAAVLVLLFVMQLPFIWVWVILLGLLCWFLNVFVVWLLGRWRIWSYELSELSKLKLLSAANAISTIIAGNAYTALQELEKAIPDLVLMDIRLPGMDGLEALKRIKKKYKDIQTIMITAYSSIANRAKALELGANDYMTKPFNNDELIFKIREGLKRNLEKEM